MKNILRILTTPFCWLRNHRTNKMWDNKLNELLDNYEFEIVNNYTASLGGRELWYRNSPYACFTAPWMGYDVMPTRKTVFRALDKLKPKLEEYHIKEFNKKFN